MHANTPSPRKPTPMGLMSAIDAEMDRILHEMEDVEVVKLGMREFHKGTWQGRPLVAVFSRWGKVAAASTATTLVQAFGVRQVIFTGVAGGIAPGLRVGDVVIAEHLVHHDLDARPIFPRFQVPLLDIGHMPADPELSAHLATAAESFLAEAFATGIPEEDRIRFGLDAPRVVRGLIASGDKFFGSSKDRDELLAALPGTLCVEMEGAAVAQVCLEHGVPFAILRTISDAADEQAAHNFPRFMNAVASRYARNILERALRSMA